MNMFERPQNNNEVQKQPPIEIPDDIFDVEPLSAKEVEERDAKKAESEPFDFTGNRVDPSARKALEQQKRADLLKEIHGNA